jgi:hypothetical protein
VPDVAVLGGDAEELLLYAGNGDGTFLGGDPLDAAPDGHLAECDDRGPTSTATGSSTSPVVHMGDDTAIVFEGNGTDFVVPVDTS